MQLSFVFPCLNEEASLGQCIKEVRGSLEGSGVEYEIIVADNGSTDRSPEIARENGARLVPVKQRGYGAALRGGIEAAAAPWVIFADADSTYLLGDTLALYKKAVAEDADMAVASRIIGKIEPGAMPPLHRWLGTPVLTTLINTLFRGNLTDCNSGFRCLKKTSYLDWGIRSDGMEFASELLIKAFKKKAKAVEIPSGLRCGPPDRVAHLRTWRDGMRHLLFILAERPELFEWTGLTLVVLSTFLQLVAGILGPTTLGVLNIFNLHSQALLLLGGLTGAQLYLLSCFVYLSRTSRPLPFTERLLHLHEGTLFFSLLMLFGLQAAVVIALFFAWAGAGFEGLDLVAVLLLVIHLLATATLLTIGLLGLHIFKKSAQAN
jgi:glycosyltransferase involved in cell wall biosynthesis